jgi:hypothetical protein
MAVRAPRNLKEKSPYGGFLYKLIAKVFVKVLETVVVFVSVDVSNRAKNLLIGFQPPNDFLRSHPKGSKLNDPIAIRRDASSRCAHGSTAAFFNPVKIPRLIVVPYDRQQNRDRQKTTPSCPTFHFSLLSTMTSRIGLGRVGRGAQSFLVRGAGAYII